MTYKKQLKNLVEDYIKPQVDNPKIVQAFLKTPRHLFVPKNFKDQAYRDIALPIDCGQTISQPSLVALMTDLLKLDREDKVLEIGTGSGYQTAILAQLAKQVYTVEILPSLVYKAKKTLRTLGLKNIHFTIGDGSFGLKKYSPYDAIIVTAGAKKIPQQLIKQLREGGRIVIPVGKNIEDQVLMYGIKRGGKIKIREIEPVRFVPLVGKYGWRDNS